MTERDMEDQIAADPQRFLGEPDLTLVARQHSIGSYRFDLLFADRHGGKLIVEIQKGTLDRAHAYKILDYYFEYRDANPSEFTDVMVVANQITAERKKRLHDFGITFREIPESMFSSARSDSDVKNDASDTREASAALASDGDDSTGVTAAEAPDYRFKSLGASSFVEAVRDGLSKDRSLERWKLGGRSSLTAVAVAAKELLDARFGRGFYPQLWMERPKNGTASCKFEVAYAIPSLGTEENKGLRETIALSLRRLLSSRTLPTGVEIATGSTIAKCVVAVDAIKTIADDTSETVAMYSGEIARIADFVRFLDGLIVSWVERADLPA